MPGSGAPATTPTTTMSPPGSDWAPTSGWWPGCTSAAERAPPSPCPSGTALTTSAAGEKPRGDRSVLAPSASPPIPAEVNQAPRRGAVQRHWNTVPAKCPVHWVRSVAAAPSRPLGLSLSYPLVFPANAGTQGPRSIGWQPKGHRATKGSAARRVLLFKRAQAPRRWKAYCIEVRSVATALPWFLGPRFRGGNERAGTRTSCRRNAHCAGVRAVAAAPPWLLGPRFPTPRFPGESRDPGTTEHWTATKRTSGRQGLCGTEGAVFQESSSTAPAECLLR